MGRPSAALHPHRRNPSCSRFTHSIAGGNAPRINRYETRTPSYNPSAYAIALISTNKRNCHNSSYHPSRNINRSLIYSKNIGGDEVLNNGQGLNNDQSHKASRASKNVNRKKDSVFI
jgi:hypothetical protein